MLVDLLAVTLATLLAVEAASFSFIFLFAILVVVQVKLRSPAFPLLLVILLLVVLVHRDRENIRKDPDGYAETERGVLMGEASRLLQGRIERDEQLLLFLGSSVDMDRRLGDDVTSRLSAFELLRETTEGRDGRRGLVVFDEDMDWYAWSGEPRGVDMGPVRNAAEHGARARVLKGAVYTVLTMAAPIVNPGGKTSGVVFLSDLVSLDSRLEGVAFLRNGFLDELRRTVGAGGDWGEVVPAEVVDEDGAGISVTSFDRPIAVLNPPAQGELSVARGARGNRFLITVVFLLITWLLVSGLSLRGVDRMVTGGMKGREQPYAVLGTGMIVILSILLLFRQALIWLNVPSVFGETSLFSPNLFASSLLDTFSRSVGDFFLSSSFLLAGALWFLFRSRLLKREVGVPGCRVARIAALAAGILLPFILPLVLYRLFGDTSTELLVMARQIEAPPFAFWEGAIFMLILTVVFLSAALIHLSLEKVKGAAAAFPVFLLGFGLLLPYSLGDPMADPGRLTLFLVPLAVLSAAYIIAGGFLRKDGRAGPIESPVSILVGVVAASAILFPLIIDKRYEVIVDRAEELFETAVKPIDTWATFILEEFIRESEGQSIELSDEIASRELAFARWADSPLSDAGSASSLSIFDRQGRRISTFSLLAEPLPDDLAAYLLGEVYSRQEPFIYSGFVAGEQYYIAAVPLSDSLGVTGMMLARIPTGLQRRVEWDTAPFLRNADLLPPGVSLRISVLGADEDLPLPLRQRERDTKWIVLEDGIDREGRVLASARSVEPGGRSMLVQIPVIATRVILGMLVAVLLLNAAFTLPLSLIIGFLCHDRRRRLELRRKRSTPGSFRMRLSISLFVFALIPTIMWGVLSRRTIVDRMARETKAEADRILTDSQLFLLGEVETDAGEGVDQERFPDFPFPTDEYMASLAEIMEAELFLYADNVLISSSRPDLIQSGILTPWVGAAAYGELFLEGSLAATDVLDIGPNPYMMVYRRISGGGTGREYVLATPMLLRQERVKNDVIELNYTILVAVMSMLIGSVLMGWFVASLLSKPLSQLRTGTGQIASGNLDYQLEEKRYDEFGQLFDSFNEMAREIRDSHRMLLSEKSKIESIVRNVGAGVLVLTRFGELKLGNEMAARILGEDITGFVDRPLTSTSLAGGVWKDFIEWATDPSETGEKQFVVPSDGDELVLKSTKTVAHSAEEGLLLIVIFEDATESIRSQRVLAWADLARQIAHEIKNPLTPIRLAVQHIRRLHRDGAPNFGEKLDQNVELILKEISRLGRTASQFSTFAKAETSTAGPVDAVPVIEEIIRLYSGERAPVRYSFENPGVEVPVLADEEGLRRVLLNLIENSREAVAGRGTIAIGLDVRDDGVTLSVHDDGEGIPREYLGKVFDPDFTTRTYGTGLGLTIVRRIVESWQGSVEVRSTAGEGTIVRIHLRRA